MSLDTIKCTDIIMEDNSTMHMGRTIVRKMWEQFFAKVECQIFREASPKTAAGALQRTCIINLCLSLFQNQDLDPNPTHNNLDEFYETQDFKSLYWSYWIY